MKIGDWRLESRDETNRFPTSGERFSLLQELRRSREYMNRVMNEIWYTIGVKMPALCITDTIKENGAKMKEM